MILNTGKYFKIPTVFMNPFNISYCCSSERSSSDALWVCAKEMTSNTVNMHESLQHIIFLKTWGCEGKQKSNTLNIHECSSLDSSSPDALRAFAKEKTCTCTPRSPDDLLAWGNIRFSNSWEW